MKIAVLGAGNVGVPLAKALAASGHTITLSNSRSPETIEDQARSIGATAAWSADAVRAAEVIVVTVNPDAYDVVRNLLADVPDDVVVIDTSNYHPRRDGKVAALEDGQVESLWFAEQLGRPVIKAWNAVLAPTLAEKGTPSGTPGRIALPVAGDDARGRAVALELTDASGFDALDIGRLEDSWRVQPGTAAYCTELPLDALRRAVDGAERSAAPLRNDLAAQAFGTWDGGFSREDIVRLLRALTRTPDPV